MLGWKRRLAALGLILSPGWAKADYDFTTIDAPGATQTAAHGINNAGQIIGSYSSGGGYHGFLLDVDGSYTTIDVPGAILTGAEGINDAGQIVGSYYEAINRPHGFLLDVDGSYTTIDAPGPYIYTYTFGINGSGQIVGYTANAAGGFVRDVDGSYTPIGEVPNGTFTTPFGINDSGQIVGTYARFDPWCALGDVDCAFLRDVDGSYTNIDVPHAFASHAVIQSPPRDAGGD